MFASCFSELWIVKCFYHLEEAKKYQGSYSTDVLPSTKIQFCTVRMFKSTSFTHASGVMNHTFLYWNRFSLLCENNILLGLFLYFVIHIATCLQLLEIGDVLRYVLKVVTNFVKQMSRGISKSQIPCPELSRCHVLCNIMYWSESFKMISFHKTSTAS